MSMKAGEPEGMSMSWKAGDKKLLKVNTNRGC